MVNDVQGLSNFYEENLVSAILKTMHIAKANNR